MKKSSLLLWLVMFNPHYFLSSSFISQSASKWSVSQANVQCTVQQCYRLTVHLLLSPWLNKILNHSTKFTANLYTCPLTRACYLMFSSIHCLSLICIYPIRLLLQLFTSQTTTATRKTRTYFIVISISYYLIHGHYFPFPLFLTLVMPQE